MRSTTGIMGLWSAVRLCALAGAAALVLTGCGGGVPDFINGKTKFSSSKYGKASPRLTSSRNVPKGGGRAMVGKPYQVAGRWYHPKHDPNYDETGSASWYGPNFHGRQTANGEIFDQFAISAAHPTLPLPSYVRVTNLENNRSIMVRVNDRGPFVHGREIDLSRSAAEMLGYQHKGIARVRVKYVGPAPLEGDDTRMLMASYNAPTEMERRGTPQQTTRVAAVDARPSPTIRTPVPVRQSPPSRDNVIVTREGFNIVVASTTPGTTLGPLFYAAQENRDTTSSIIDSAFKATEAMATAPSQLRQWQQGVDADTRAIKVALGVFLDQQNAANVADAFSLIGAVEHQDVQIGNGEATSLVLSQLKPGATRGDVALIAARLGLQVQFLYD